MTLKIQVEHLEHPEQKDENIKQKKNEKSSNKSALRKKEKINFSCNFFIAVVIVAIAIIVAVNTIFTFFVCFPEAKEKIFSTESSNTTNLTISHEYDSIQKRIPQNTEVDNRITEMTGAEKVESTLLSSGIAIIGIAIAVWAGLNIIKALEKNKYKQLHDEIIKIEKERRILGYNTLLNSIARLNDELNRHLHTVVKELQFDYVDAEIMTQINIIELKFQELYQKHYEHEKIEREDYKYLIYDIDTQFVLTNRLEKTACKKLSLYLTVRRAEINFYLSYCGKAEEKIESAMAAINDYCEAFSLMKDPKNIDVDKTPFSYNIILNTYLLNTVGEAHRIIAQNCGKVQDNKEYILYKDKTMPYFEKMIESLEKNDNKEIQRELYYRNYGCAMETIVGITDNSFGKILYAYQKSMNICLKDEALAKPNNFNVYKVYISLIHKYTNILFQVYESNENKKCKILPSLDQLKQTIGAISYSWFKTQGVKTKEYIDLAVQHFPNKLEFLKHKAFYYRDAAIFEYLFGIKEEFNVNRELMMKIKLQLEAIIVKEDYDPFMNEIIYQYNQLCEY